MLREPIGESDLRSLERRSVRAIFAPLDPNERLPRELVIEAKRHWTLSRRSLVWVLWPPALVLVVIIGGWTNFTGWSCSACWRGCSWPFQPSPSQAGADAGSPAGVTVEFKSARAMPSSSRGITP